MKKIIIMGGTSGIGRALVEVFASRGVAVGVAGRSNQVLNELQAKYSGLIQTEIIDINMPEAKSGLIRLIRKMGGMDLYIHTSGIGMHNDSLNPEDEVKVVTTNATGFARMIATAFNYFRASGSPGQIAAVTSIASTRGIGEMAAYSASKAFAASYLEAMNQLAHGLRMDLTITDIQPGWIRTPLLTKNKNYLMEMSIEHVIPLILKAIVEKKRVAVIDRRWAMLKKAWRRIPGSVWIRMSGMSF